LGFIHDGFGSSNFQRLPFQLCGLLGHDEDRHHLIVLVKVTLLPSPLLLLQKLHL